MRVLLDANLFISYLLTPNRGSPIVTIVDTALSAGFVLLLPEDLLEEFFQAIAKHRHLKDRITEEGSRRLGRLLLEVAETIPKIAEDVPAVTRDPKDDYLLAYAFVGQADILVTTDDDLLSLGQVEQVRILRPQDFLEVLRQI